MNQLVRGISLAVALAVTCSVIFILPPFRNVDTALDTNIPDFLGMWDAESYAPSEKELAILAKDTRFSKAMCSLLRSEDLTLLGSVPRDTADLSIVVSGHDLANSIHRPERCLPAQGHRGLMTTASTIPLENERELPVTRLLTKQDLAFGPPEDRQQITRNCLIYYFFVGKDRITRSHTKRTVYDIIDRILHGEAQSWAYVMAIMPYAEGDPESPANRGLLDYDRTDKKIRQLLAELAESNIDWSKIRR